MNAKEHWERSGHNVFERCCSREPCEGPVAWETAFNYFCAEHRPWHPFRWRIDPGFRFEP